MGYTLIVCIGILWSGKCESLHKFAYPTLEACQAEMLRATLKINDGYAVCVEIKKEKK